MLNTTNPNSYQYYTKHLQINILGGVKTNKMENMRITMSIQNPKVIMYFATAWT